MGVRRLWSLLNNLPAGSAVHRVLEPDSWSWSVTDELLAMLIEVVGEGNRMYAIVNSKKGSRTPEPIRVPRPWDVKKPRALSGVEEVRAFFGANAKVDTKREGEEGAGVN